MEEHQYYKVLRKDLTHNYFKYDLGLNVDIRKFNPSGSCESGGLYFTTLKHIAKYLEYGDLIAYVSIPKGESVYADPDKDKFKAHRIFITKLVDIKNFPHWNDALFCLNAVKQNGYALKYISNQTDKLCLVAVKQWAEVLKYVNNQTEHICLIAIQQDWRALKYIYNQTERICLTAINKNWRALEYISNQTEHLCLTAIQQDWNALRLVDNQTERVCLAAIKQNCYALILVDNQTEHICLTAISYDANAINYIRRPNCSLWSAVFKRMYNKLFN